MRLRLEGETMRNTLRLIGALALIFLSSVMASPVHANQTSAKCLQRAEQFPDQAAAESQVWIKKGGGDPARVCFAFAQFHRGEYESAAREFAALAARMDKLDGKRAASLHARAGLSAMRANDSKMADKEYAAAIKLEPQDPDIWIDRATGHAASEHYWEALDDLNRALDIMPDMPEALRLRAQVRVKLGQDLSAKSDFEAARGVEEAEKEAGTKR
jgi:tetratricopeptide (TPR) repeat protein